ncbi:MAG: helix-turn-helix domain-containing protein [Planctomycetes bacterium]|nr:helix-turn-helix domain-containing protein [Planctomycetota bacterium]
MNTLVSDLEADLASANPRPLYTVAESAELSRVHLRTVRRWIAAGILPTVGARKGGSSRVLVRRRDLAAFLVGITS